MTDNLPELQELEPLEDGVQQAGTGAGSEALLVAMRSGMGPPAFNPSCTDKASYKMLMASTLMVIGCFMPHGPDSSVAGYQTMTGAFMLFISLGMLWTWWGAIHNNRSTAASLKWLALCFVPFAVYGASLAFYQPFDALVQAQDRGLMVGYEVSKWSTIGPDMLAAMGREYGPSTEASMKVEAFFRCFGPGKVLLLLGGLLAEVFFIMGIAGGAKQNKEQKLARQKAAQERKRR
jgi:hypothetical protein